MIEKDSEVDVLTFTIDDIGMAFPVRKVREVLSEAHFEDVPLAPEYIRGMFTLRGQIVTAVDLRVRLGLQAASRLSYSIIIVQLDTEIIGFVVDDIGDVKNFEIKKAENLPSNIKSKWHRWSDTLIRDKNQLFIVLDVENLINHR